MTHLCCFKPLALWGFAPGSSSTLVHPVNYNHGFWRQHMLSCLTRHHKDHSPLPGGRRDAGNTPGAAPRE